MFQTNLSTNFNVSSLRLSDFYETKSAVSDITWPAAEMATIMPLCLAVFD